jgi:putative aldouronate transport system substrate-binding protein
MVKRSFLATFILLLCISLIACSNGGGAAEQKDEAGVDSADGVQEGNKVVTITTARAGNPPKFKNGETIDDNVHTRWAKDELGIQFEYIWKIEGGNDQFNNKVRLALSAGETLPDVFLMRDSQLAYDLIRAGKVMPLDEAIEKYASPKVKVLFNEHPKAFYPATVNGKRYGIPLYTSANGSSPILWIRQDWLTKLNLEAPKTISELENIMDAFVNQDPDGNGQKDTIGITIAMKNKLATWMADSSALFGSYGEYLPGYWNEGSDGNLVYGSTQPNVKQGLAKLREWYEKGYLDKQVALLDESKAVESFVSGKSGIVFGPAWMYSWPLPDLLKNNPKADPQPFALPSGEDGNIGRMGENLSQGHFLIREGFEHVDKFFEYFNALYDYPFGDSEYFVHGLFEGYDYTMIDGKPVYDHDKIPGGYVDPGEYFLTHNSVEKNIPFFWYDTVQKIYEGKEPVGAIENNYAANPEPFLKAGAITNQQNDHAIYNQFTAAPTKTLQSKWEFLEKMEKETFAKIVYGEVGLDQFDSFVEKWKSSGGDVVTEEVNEWYKSIK